MKVNKIELFNYKGFEKLSATFNDDINIFIGENAAGKSSLLEAILKGLFFFTKPFAPLGHPRNQKVELNIGDIRYGEKSTAVLLTVKPDGYEKTRLYNEVHKVKNDHPEEYYIGYENVKNFRIEKNNLVSHFKDIIGKSKISVPIIKFYPANRNSVKNDANTRWSSNLEVPQLEAWANIYQDDNSFMKFFDWFFEFETLELRYQRDRNSFNDELPELKCVRDAVKEALKILSGKSYSIKSDQYKNDSNNTLLKTITLTTNYHGRKKTDRLENKSDGEKSIISMVADIAYNLSIANAENYEDSENYLKCSGIVIIDEIGGHLHPKWQRLIIPILRDIFPNIQFFISTHSPQVISSVKSENIFYMEDFKIEPISFKTKGVDTNTLLEYVFNSYERPKEVIDLLDSFDKKIEENKPVKELEKIINDIITLFNSDSGNNADPLLNELHIRLESYKYDLENEVDK